MTITRIPDTVGTLFEDYLPLSANGRIVAFMGRTSLVPGDGNAELDVYMRDFDTGTIRLVSATPAGLSGESSSRLGDLSGDGTRVVFETFARQVSGATIGNAAVVVKDMASGAVLRVDRNAAGVDGNNGSGNASISDDGRYVAFHSYATNLVNGDVNGYADVFVKDLATGTVVNASMSSTGGAADRESHNPILSGNGKAVAFNSSAPSLGTAGPDYIQAVHVKNLVDGTLSQASSSLAGAAANGSSSGLAMSTDARWVAFSSSASNLLPDGVAYGQLYAKDMHSGLVLRISADASGTPANQPSFGVSLSGDGRFAVFSSSASNLVPGEANNNTHVFLKDLLTGAIVRLSVSDAGVQGNVGSGNASISADGATVSFRSAASNLVANDSNGQVDGFLVAVDPAFLNAWANLRSGSNSGETMTGGAGADLLRGLGGNDTIDGAAGLDMAVLRGHRSSYTVAHTGAGFTVNDRTGLDGNDTLLNMERLHFADASVALDINGVGGQAYRVYQAAFNRTPDAGGVGFWIAQMDKGASLETVAAHFMASPEFVKMYGAAPGNAALVDKFYTNVLHRQGEAAGVKYWTDALDNKVVTRAQVLAMISESAENQAALIGVIENGFAYLEFGA